jgi:deoxyhypusine monooxygenase
MNDSSALLRHEIAFVLGQMKDPYAIPFLTSVLENLQENSMVRHEVRETLAQL